jgi:outer membrane protein assembly factor BamB
MTADQNGTEVVAFGTGTGRRLWTRHVGEFLDSAGDDGWAGYADGTVYIAGSRNPEGTTGQTLVGALDARTGRRLWSVTLTGGPQYPALSNGIIYASTASRRAVCASRGNRVYRLDLPSHRLHRRPGGQQRHLVCRRHQRQRLRATDVT